MKTLLIALFLLWIGVTIALASGCFFKYSYVSGMNKICVYQCYDGDRAITIDAYAICPYSL